MKTYFETRAAADQAARRVLKARFGKSYMPKAKVDFIVCRSAYGENYGMWRYDLMVLKNGPTRADSRSMLPYPTAPQTCASKVPSSRSQGHVSP